MNLSHLMYDLETLSTAPDACIVQIGAVRFDPWGKWSGSAIGELCDPAYHTRPGLGLISTPKGEFRRNITLTTASSGTIDAGTVLWWMQQSADAQRRVFEDEDRHNLDQALLHFTFWIYDQGEPEHVWADSQDHIWLANAYKRCGMQYPFAYNQGRDFRTLRKLAPEIEEPIFVGVQHDALDDAHHQAIWASNILRALKLRSTDADGRVEP